MPDPTPATSVAGVPANFSIVTLGVRDLDASIAFYRALGWEMRGDRSQGIVWFKTSGTWIGLFPDDELAADAGLPASGWPAGGSNQPAYRGVTLAINTNSEAEVDAAFAHVRRIGGRVVKEPTRAEWGGYSGYFADPDGHLWEVAKAGFVVDADGRITID